jgi:putative hydrolase of the HAD superfamily
VEYGWRVVRAVLFDAAGTLLHLREPVGRTYARLAREFGVVRDEGSLQGGFAQAFRAMPPMVFPRLAPTDLAEHERRWWRDLVARTFHDDRTGRFSDFEAFFARLFEHFAGEEAWTCAPGAREVLARLRALGLRTGIVSNFDQRLHALLAALELRRLLDIVVLPADAGAAKPDPAIFELALHRLELAAAQVVYVGDDEVEDVRGAAALGMGAIDVTRLGDLREVLERIGVGQVQ